MVKLEVVNGRVAFLYKTSSGARTYQTSADKAIEMIENGTLCESDVADYGICVDRKYYFKGEVVE